MVVVTLALRAKLVLCEGYGVGSGLGWNYMITSVVGFERDRSTF